ncbi:MAG: hypothetical protein ABIP21_11735 [Acidimicrobiia bacterium]
MRRDIVRVTGPDTWTFLQSLLSQDVANLADDDSLPTMLLTPQGKVDVVGVITRAGDDAVIDTDPGWGERLIASLTRFKIRTKVELTLEAAPDVDTDAFAAEEAARIAAGVPRMGADLDDSVIPQEAFLELDAVSFTKGCFIGQELVCRIDSRGHVNRFLRHVVPDDSGVTLPVGAEIVVGEKVVGSITSSAPGAAIGFVRREVDPPASATVGRVAAQIAALPSA